MARISILFVKVLPREVGQLYCERRVVKRVSVVGRKMKHPCNDEDYYCRKTREHGEMWVSRHGDAWFVSGGSTPGYGEYDYVYVSFT